MFLGTMPDDKTIIADYIKFKNDPEYNKSEKMLTSNGIILWYTYLVCDKNNLTDDVSKNKVETIISNYIEQEKKNNPPTFINNTEKSFPWWIMLIPFSAIVLFFIKRK